MAFDWTQFLRDEVLEDYVGRPIKVNIGGVSKKYRIKLTIEVEEDK